MSLSGHRVARVGVEAPEEVVGEAALAQERRQALLPYAVRAALPRKAAPLACRVNTVTASGVGSQVDEQFRNTEVVLLACAVPGLPGASAKYAIAPHVALPYKSVPLPCSVSGPGDMLQNKQIRKMDLGSSGAYWAVSHVATVTHRRVIPMYPGLEVTLHDLLARL